MSLEISCLDFHTLAHKLLGFLNDIRRIRCYGILPELTIIMSTLVVAVVLDCVALLEQHALFDDLDRLILCKLMR